MILSGRKPSAKWLPTDRMLAMALVIYDQSKCSGCGSYLDEAYGGGGTYEVQTTTCSGCAAMHRHRKDTKEVPGEKAWPVNTDGQVLDEDEIAPSFD